MMTIPHLVRPIKSRIVNTTTITNNHNHNHNHNNNTLFKYIYRIYSINRPEGP